MKHWRLMQCVAVFENLFILQNEMILIVKCSLIIHEFATHDFQMQVSTAAQQLVAN